MTETGLRSEPREADFRALAENLPALCWMADADGWITWYNRRWYAVTGTTAEQMRGWGWQAVHDPVRLPDVMATWQASIATGEPFAMTFPLRMADGGFRPFLTRVDPVRDADGRIVRWFGVNADISEQKVAEDALRRSERTLRLITDALPVLVSYIDRDHVYRFNNRSYETWFGLPSGSVAGRRVRDVVGEAVYAHRVPFMERALAGETLVFDAFMPHRDGRGRACEIRYIPHRGDVGTVEGFFVLVIDIDERKAAETRRLALAELGDRLSGLTDTAEIAQAAAEVVGTTLGLARVGYGTVDPVAGTVTVERDWTAPGIASIAGTLHFRDHGGYVDDLKRGETVVVADVVTDPRTRDRTGALAALAVTSFLDMPVMDRGCLVGVLHHEDTAARDWPEEDIAFVRTIAERTWAVIERARAEAARRESEEQFRVFAQAMPNHVWAASADGVPDWFNDRVYAYSGSAAGALVGLGWTSLVHPDDVDEAGEAWARAIATQSVYETEFRIRRRDGAYRWFLVRAVPIRTAEGSVARWVGTNTDINDQKRVSAELLRFNETLEHEVEARTRDRDRIWKVARDLIVVVDRDGRHKRVNPAWTEGFGDPNDTVLGARFSDFVHPDDQAGIRAFFDGVVAGEPMTNFEARMRARDGSYRVVAWIVVAMGEDFYASGRDLTGQRKAEEQLRQSQKLEAIGQLTGGVAHDFNNLLTVIRSSVEMMQRPDLPEERRRRYVAAIADTVTRAARLTGQLLAFARRQALQPEVFEVGRAVAAIGDMIGTLTGSRIRIAIRPQEAPLSINADPSQFDTALVNLAVNARDAMDGEGALTIGVEAAAGVPESGVHPAIAGAFVAVSIADTGSGIAPDDLDRVFEPFFTTKEVGQGTGLGLSQVFGFAKQSGGEVRVESALGRGTTFTVYLPRVGDGPAEPASSVGPEPLAAGHGTRVLIVEDNAAVGSLASRALSELGYATVLVDNAEAALAALATDASRFDAVFSDVVMPGMNGIDLAAEIGRRHPTLPVVLTSGYSHVLAENGTHGVTLLHKPYSIEQLSRVLNTVVCRTRRRG